MMSISMATKRNGSRQFLLGHLHPPLLLLMLMAKMMMARRFWYSEEKKKIVLVTAVRATSVMMRLRPLMHLLTMQCHMPQLKLANPLIQKEGVSTTWNHVY